MLLEFVQTLTEGIRTPHPEDSIFQGSTTALEVIQGMVGAVQNPESVTLTVTTPEVSPVKVKFCE